MSKNFSLKAISAVSGKSASIIGQRARKLGIRTGRKGFTKEQAHNLIYYQPKNSVRRRTETLEQESARLIAALQEINSRMGKQTVIAV